MQGISALFDRWKELLTTTNTATNEEFKWSTEEIKKSLKGIEGDIADLEDTISVVENNRTKFKIEDDELRSRKKFVSDTRAQLAAISNELQNTRTRGKLENDQREMLMKRKAPVDDKYARLNAAIEEDNEQFIHGQREAQARIIREQDQDLDQLSHTVVNLHEISKTITGALDEQAELIDDIERDVDRADSGIRGAFNKVNKLLDSTSDRCQYIIIIVMLLALIGLIIAVIYIPGKW